MDLLPSPPGAALLACAAVLVTVVLLVRSVRAGGPRARVVVSRLAWAAFVLVVVGLTVSLDPGGGGRGQPGAVRDDPAAADVLNPRPPAYNLLGNLALLVPFAVLSRAAWGWRVLTTTAAGVALSVAVEVGQRYSGRSADVDDVLVNGLGALLGAVLAAVVVRLARRADEPEVDAEPEPALAA